MVQIWILSDEKFVRYTPLEKLSRNIVENFVVNSTNVTDIRTNQYTNGRRKDKIIYPRHKCRGYIYLQWDSKKATFHFSHYKSMDTLSCHSNESTSATSTRAPFVAANVMNISEKFQIHLPYGFWGDDFLNLFANLAFLLSWQPIKFSSLDKIHTFGRGIFL